MLVNASCGDGQAEASQNIQLRIKSNRESITITRLGNIHLHRVAHAHHDDMTSTVGKGEGGQVVISNYQSRLRERGHLAVILDQSRI